MRDLSLWPPFPPHTGGRRARPSREREMLMTVLLSYFLSNRDLVLASPRLPRLGLFLPRPPRTSAFGPVGADDEKSCMLLVMRVLSILPLNFKPQPWSAPLSRELLVFNSFVRSLTRALRTLLEVTSLNMLLRHDARRARDDLLDINLSLPFQTEVNTGFGVLAKVYLDALTHINGRQRVRDPNAEGVREAKQMALDICEETFPGVKNPKMEVERGFRFWDVVSALVPVRCSCLVMVPSSGGVVRCAVLGWMLIAVRFCCVIPFFSCASCTLRAATRILPLDDDDHHAMTYLPATNEP
ncbi:temperature dependent protein affecting M2 dsRNA replication-domain-containing protein [Cubamyces lactineus]|nr:temperature dependent protein affecting M2 dsRNA replication-domain-containing protein [Cubamyces lactineus]